MRMYFPIDFDIIRWSAHSPYKTLLYSWLGFHVVLMRRLLVNLLLSALVTIAPLSVAAQDFETLFWDFDSTSLTWEDRRFLQAGLAFEGQYFGLLDGDWGRLSRQSMTRFSYQEFEEATQNWHMAALAFSLFERIEREGWLIYYFEPLGLSFLYPAAAVSNDPSTEMFVNWRHTHSSLRYSFGIHPLQTVANLHDYTVRWHEASAAPYTIRKSRLLVTGATNRHGSRLYTRSDLINGHWSTVMLSATSRDSSILQAVASSIVRGRAPDLRFTPGGRLDDAIRKTLLILEKESSEPTGQVNSEPAEPENRGSSGSGFYVSRNGHVLTNAHVIEACSSITVDGLKATVVAKSEDFDLAILQAALPEDVAKTVAVFAAGPARLNSDVTAAGFPYGGMLGGLNITRGSVSSLKGLGGDAKTMQITAPVQAGNSGGPLIAATGAVVGVVVSKLDAELVSDAIGDLPQNVNFAIRGEIAKLFLSQNGVEPSLSLSGTPLDPVKLAELASKYTVFITCD